MASIYSDGDDWGLEGHPKWWWKYVLPNPEEFYGQLLAQAARNERVDPTPVPWLQHASGAVLEGLAMFHASVRMGDREGGARRKAEAFAQLSHAVNQLGQEAGFVGVDQPVGAPIGPRTRAGAGTRTTS